MADKIKLTIQETVEANTVTIITQTTTVNVAEFLNVDVAGGLSESDIDTFAKLDTIVSDKSLVNLEDAQTFAGVTTFTENLTLNDNLNFGAQYYFQTLFGDLTLGVNGGTGASSDFVLNDINLSSTYNITASGFDVSGKTNADVVLAGGGTASYGTVVATGTVIDLSIKDSEYNQVTPLTDLVYTFTGSTVGNFAKVSLPIGLASYPTITGASLIESPTFDTNKKSYMILEYTSNGAEYFFIHR